MTLFFFSLLFAKSRMPHFSKSRVPDFKEQWLQIDWETILFKKTYLQMYVYLWKVEVDMKDEFNQKL